MLPMFGYTLFSWLAILGKNLHNFVGPLFVFCTLVMFVTFVRDNLWRAMDFTWFAKAGGLLSGEHVPSGRFNAWRESVVLVRRDLARTRQRRLGTGARFSEF